MTPRRFLVIATLLTAFQSPPVAPVTVQKCLSCWDLKCGDDSTFEEMCSTSCECLNGYDEDKCAAVPEPCCQSASNYTTNQVHDQLVEEEYAGTMEQCSTSYNAAPTKNFLISNSECMPDMSEFCRTPIIDTNSEYVFRDIQFPCSGCIDNITVHHGLSIVSDKSITVQIWTPYRHISSNTTVLRFKNSTNVDLLASNDESFANGDRYEVEGHLNGNLCFERGDVFGVFIPSDLGDIGIAYEANTSNSAVYSRTMQACPSLEELFFLTSTSITNRLLIDISVTPNELPVSSQMSTVVQTSTAVASVSSTVTRTTTDTFSPVPSISTISSTSTPVTMTPLMTTSSAANTGTADFIPIIGGAAGGAIFFVAVVLVLACVVCCLVCRKKSSRLKITGPQDAEMTSCTPPDLNNMDIGVPLSNCNTDFNDSIPVHVYDRAVEPQYDAPRVLEKYPMRGSNSSLPDNYTPMHQVNTGTPSVASVSNHSERSWHHPMMFNNTPTPPIPSHYSSPRSTPMTPDVSASGVYDTANILDVHKPRGTLKQHIKPPLYYELENPEEKKYFELECGPVYHVLENDHHVPTAEERLSLSVEGVAAPGYSVPNLPPKPCFKRESSYWDPATTENAIYEQLNANSCREIARDKLQLQDLLGEGQFGTVHKATWYLKGGAHKKVAVKVLKKREEKVRFLREGARMMQFFHPNVVEFQGMVTIGEPVLLVQEFMKEGDLETYLKKCRPPTNTKELPSNKQLLKFCRDVANGMKHLAKMNFVHRDLAARNVLLNDHLVCKISDFGMTRELHHSYDRTKTEQIPLRWTAPEAMQREYSEKSDVYSYAMVLYEIWSLGHRPFPALSDHDIVPFIKAKKLTPPPPGCPRSLYRLMVKCWHISPSSRPTFVSIVDDYLSTDDESILTWTTEDRSVSKQAYVIGAPLSEGHFLYEDLQKEYL